MHQLILPQKEPNMLGAIAVPVVTLRCCAPILSMDIGLCEIGKDCLRVPLAVSDTVSLALSWLSCMVSCHLFCHPCRCYAFTSHLWCPCSYRISWHDQRIYSFGRWTRTWLLSRRLSVLDWHHCAFNGTWLSSVESRGDSKFPVIVLFRWKKGEGNMAIARLSVMEKHVWQWDSTACVVGSAHVWPLSQERNSSKPSKIPTIFLL